MIAFISGRVIRKNAGSIVIENNGLGYAVSVIPQLSMSLKIDEEIALHTVQIFREDSVTLFGFTSEAELEMFQLLGTVTGVGPKSALTIIAQLGVEGLQKAVATADDAMFRSVSGIGPKTAKLIVLNLSGKLVLDDGSISEEKSNVLAALINLGYQDKLARAALQKVSLVGADLGEAELLKAALSELSSARKVGQSE